MKIGVVGLGLIGGSLAKAYKRAGHQVLGFDRDTLTLDFTKLSGAVDETLGEENLNDCDVILLAIPVEFGIKWLEENAPHLTKDTLVIDCCGVKRSICQVGFRLMEESNLHFVGGHPMAGSQVWGFKNSREDLFDGSVFAIVPKDMNDIWEMTRVKKILMEAGFTDFQVMTAAEHDEIIAFTSQLSHVVSNAFVKSGNPSLGNSPIAGGSFRDMTRVAYLDEVGWSNLMMENRDNLLEEMEKLQEELSLYQKALQERDKDSLRKLLEEGRKQKELIEKR